MEVELTAPIVQCATDRFGALLAALQEDGQIALMSGGDMRTLETIKLKNPRPTSIAMGAINGSRAIVVGCANGEVILIHQQTGNAQNVIGGH